MNFVLHLSKIFLGKQILRVKRIILKLRTRAQI